MTSAHTAGGKSTILQRAVKDVKEEKGRFYEFGAAAWAEWMTADLGGDSFGGDSAELA